MKVAISGGMGFEDLLLKELSCYQIYLVGGSYDLTNERFENYTGCEFYPEFVTHNYYKIFSMVDVYIDISISNKSKFILADFVKNYGKVGYFLIFNNAWKIYKISFSGCLRCVIEYKKSMPFFLLPEVNFKSVCDFFANEKDRFLRDENFSFDLLSGEKEKLHFDLHTKDHEDLSFMNGHLADVVSVSCGDNSVAVSPMDNRSLDLSFYKGCLSQRFRIVKESPFFIEFKVEKYRVLLFRQGRVVVKGTKEKNTALYIYYKYIGD